MLLFFPVTSASVERAISALKIVKHSKREQDGESRLNTLLMLLDHKDVKVHVDKVLDLFAAKKSRWMVLANLLAD